MFEISSFLGKDEVLARMNENLPKIEAFLHEA
jgi:hypothetical protein